MASPASTTDNANPPIPYITQPNIAPYPSPSASITSSGSEREQPAMLERPRLTRRKPNPSIIVPRDHPEIEIREEEFPPDDARAMSPRRSPSDVERLGQEVRQNLKEYAIQQLLCGL